MNGHTATNRPIVTDVDWVYNIYFRESSSLSAPVKMLLCSEKQRTISSCALSFSPSPPLPSFPFIKSIIFLATLRLACQILQFVKSCV